MFEISGSIENTSQLKEDQKEIRQNNDSDILIEKTSNQINYRSTTKSIEKSNNLDDAIISSEGNQESIID